MEFEKIVNDILLKLKNDLNKTDDSKIKEYIESLIKYIDKWLIEHTNYRVKKL